MTFSPSQQTSIWDIQTTIRRIDASLFPSVKQSLGTQQTFAYSTLAGCCAFVDSCKKSTFSSDIQSFADTVVSPVIQECFKEIEKFGYDLNNATLKMSLLKQIDKVLFYPERRFIQSTKDERLISELEKIIRVGTYTLYKLDPKAEKFYGGRIDIPEEIYERVAEVVEKHGYKQTGDVLGSSADKQGHITTIEPREMITHYDDVVSHHHTFIDPSAEVDLQPVDIICGSPQSGRLFRVMAIGVEPKTLEAYRGKLGKIKPPPHLSVFTQEIQVIPSLRDASIIEFTGKMNGSTSSSLSAYLQGRKAKESQSEKNFKTAALVGLFALATSWILYKKTLS